MPIQQTIVGRKAGSYHQIPAGGASSAVACPGTGSIVVLQAEAQSIRYRIDSIDPTTTVGFLLEAGQTHELRLTSGAISDIRIIEVTAGAIVNIHTFK